MGRKEFIDALTLWPWLRDWDEEPWREPDKAEDFGGHFQAVWYGFPGEIVTTALMVELSSDAYVVTEYTHISEWYMDEPWDPDEHGDFYRLQVAAFKPAFIRTTLRHALWGSPAERQRIPKRKVDVARWTAGIGMARISYMGGDEDEASTLP
jgi:hypothetical protein